MKPHTCFLLNIIISDIVISAPGAVFFSLKIYLDDHESSDEADNDSDEQLATYNKLVLAINYVQRLAMDCGICFITDFEL